MITKLKTRIAIMSINAVKKKYPGIRVLVVVPTTTLKSQWEEEIYNWDLSFNAEVEVVNTVIKHDYTCDFLVLDK